MVFIWKMFYEVKKLWLRLTIHWPRRMPTNAYDFLEVRQMLSEIYDLPKDETTWIILASHIENVKPPKLTVSYSYLVGMVKRFYINKMLHEEKIKYYEASEQVKKDLKLAQEKAETSASGADLAK